MSERHPIIAITGSSGAGTSTVTRTFQNIFRREGVRAAIAHHAAAEIEEAAPRARVVTTMIRTHRRGANP